MLERNILVWSVGCGMMCVEKFRFNCSGVDEGDIRMAKGISGKKKVDQTGGAAEEQQQGPQHG